MHLSDSNNTLVKQGLAMISSNSSRRMKLKMLTMTEMVPGGTDPHSVADTVARALHA